MRHRNLAPASRGSSCREDSPRSMTSGVGMTAGGGARYPGVPQPSGNKGRRRKPLPRLRGLGCAGSWCKPQDLSPERSGPSVPAMAADMLQRGWVTSEEYTQLLMGDRLYRMHEADEARGEGQVANNEPAQGSTSSKKSRPGLMRSLSRKKCMKTVGAAHSSKGSSTPEKKKTELPVDNCRDPITLDDLGSWTWDFHASEAATPPVSCGGTLAATKSCVDVSKRGKEGRISGKGRSSSWKGKGKGKGRSGGLDGCGNSSSSCSSSAVVTYNVESLVLYLLESGDFQEPTTRRPFSLVQLADLDALAARAGAKVKGSLVKSYQEGQAKYRERRELREMLVGADRCLGDVVSEMLSTIEDSEEPHEEAHVYLVTLFPQFSHIFSELKEADEEFARQCLDQYKGTLRGPPNHPTQEQGGLLRTAMEFLNEQGRGILDEAVDANEQHQPGDAADPSDGDVVNQGDGNVTRQGGDGEVVAAESNVEGSETGEGEGDTVSDDGSMSIYSL